jgi:hypothetical protein
MAVIIVGLAAYLLGAFWLYRERPPKAGPVELTPYLFLVILPLAIPITFMMPFITWKWPVSSLYGVPLLWELPHAVSLLLGLIWLAMSVWVVTRRDAPAGPRSATIDAKTPVLN